MMFSIEEILCEIHGEETNDQGLPPGFRFHPTDEELITFYLASKVFNGSFSGVEITEIDLNRCEPWELPDVAKMGEREWYFFSQRDRKYPTGLRTNRATEAGYWKATGKDREVFSASNGTLLGMKKTLVFYKGRAPRGVKTKWIMHEYRLEGDFSSFAPTCKEEWVLCRILCKKGVMKKNQLFPNNSYLHEMLSSPPFFAPILETSRIPFSEAPTTTNSHQSSLLGGQETDVPYGFAQQNYPTNFLPSCAPITEPISCTMLKSLISHQEEQTTEGNFCHFEPMDASFYCMDKVEADEWEKGVSFELDYSRVLGYSAAGTGAGDVDTVHEMSTSVAFSNKTGFQMMFDPSPFPPPIIRY